MAFLGMDNEEGEPIGSVVHSNFLFDEERSHPIASLVCEDFEEDFSPPMYDKYEDRCSEYEGPKWDVFSCSSNLELLYQEELISLDFIEDIPCEMHEGKHVLGSGIWSEVTDVSFTSCHEHPLHGYSQEQLDNMQG